MAKLIQILKNNMKTALALLVISISLTVILFFATGAGAGNPEDCKTYLWRVENHHYMFGTMHVPTKNLWDTIPNVVKRAFLRSDAVYFEVDSYDTEFWRNLTECREKMKEDLKVQASKLPNDVLQKVHEVVKKIQNITTAIDLTNWKDFTIEDLEHTLQFVPYYTPRPKESREDLVELEDCLKTECPAGFSYDYFVEINQIMLDAHISKDNYLDSYLEQEWKSLESSSNEF